MIDSGTALPFGARLLFVLALAAMLLALAAPAAADYRRSCRAVLEVRPTGSPMAIEAYQWRVYNTVSLYAQVNEARREARRAIVTCMMSHWADRDGDRVPHACQSHGSLEFSGYPFADLAQQLQDDICGASDELRHSLDLILFIDGERGCVVDGGNINPATRVDIASGYRLNCPIPEGGGSECVGPDCGGDDDGPTIGDAGGWECVGEGCGGASSPDPSSEYRILPNVRLPGNDVGYVDVADGDWQACATQCSAHPLCEAWTYRDRFAGVDSVCLLKSAAGPMIPDTCCRSGIAH